jgi:hypothetical protein
MNRTKLWLVVTGIVFVLTTVIFLENPALVGAAERCLPVTIRDRDNIEPLVLSINKGDCVVWINFAGAATSSRTESEVLLVFKEGGRCLRETKAPVGFKMDDSSNCFVAGWLSHGETASLVFEVPGNYQYDIKFRFGKGVRPGGSGTIVVK